MSNKGKLKRTLIPSIAASAFLIAAISFADVIWAEPDAHKSIEQAFSPTPTPASCSSTGRLDRTFSGDGKVTTPILGGLDEAYSVAIQADGKIVAAGLSADGQGTYFALARYNADGSLDASFAGDGVVTTSFNGGGFARAVVIQSDGKIVAAGQSSGIALVRYNADGSLDTTFDGDGKVTTSPVEGRGFGNSVAIQPDGKIVVAGSVLGSTYVFLVVQYHPDGSLDTTFDDDGIVTTQILDYAAGHSMAIQTDGKIVVAGAAGDHFVLVRYNPDGKLDTTFGGNGKVTTQIFGSNGAYSVAIQADGKIVAAGSSIISSKYNFAVIRYNSNGSLDTSFDGDGKVTTPMEGSANGYAVAIQPEGRIVVAGQTWASGKLLFALVRYNPDGSLDTTFDRDGKLTTIISANQCDHAHSVAIQPDGRIVAVGYIHGCFGGPISEFAVVRYGCDVNKAFDYDADGRADISVFRPSEGAWYLNRSIDGFYGMLFGVGSDRVAPADYDDDGKTDIAVYGPPAGVWYIFNSSAGVVSYKVFGVEEDLPTPADYDGDGKADVSVYRPSTGTWYRQNSSDGSFFAVQFGTNEDKPTIGDFDGDGKADIGVYRPSTGTWYQLRSSDGGFFAEQFGNSTDKIVPADYDGDGSTDIAVYRPSTGIWYFRNSSGPAYTSYVFGVADDIPAPGDYDGDGKADISVFRPSDGTWYIANSGNGSFTIFPWGLAGDIPTPAAFRY